MTGCDLQLHLRYSNSICNKDTETKILFLHKNVFMLHVNFTGSCTEDEPNFPRQNNLILKKRCLVETRL